MLLHVGLGTFRPVVIEDIRQHKMHEHYDTPIPPINMQPTKKRVMAVGTTVVRTLETIYQQGYHPGQGRLTSLLPGLSLSKGWMLLTNFHLPGSSLLMLVAALAGIELTRHAYQQAIREGYRFFSYGDAMLII